MSASAIAAQDFVGVDVSKETLDVYHADTGKHCQIENTAAAAHELCLQLKKSQRTIMVVMEATGG